MAFSQAQATLVGGASGTSMSLTFGSNCTPGSTIVVAGSVGATSTLGFSDGTNGTYFKITQSTGTLTLAIAIFTNQQGNTPLQITMTSTANSSLHMVASEWLGVDQTSPIFFPLDLATNAAIGTSTAPSAGALGTLAQTNELVIAAATTGNTASTWTAGSGFTLDAVLTNPRVLMLESQSMGNTTTGPTGNFTIAGSTPWAAVAIALRPAATRKVLAITSGSTFPAPADWPGTADRVDLIGGGGAGRQASSSTNEGLGGGGGAYVYAYNVLMSASTQIAVGGGGSTSGASGANTWVISSASPNPFAAGGGGALAAAAGAGGLVSVCRPVGNAQGGGNGGTYVASTTAGPTGGGGAGGPFGGGGSGGSQNATGTTGGTGGGGGGCSTVNNGVAQTASNGNGTTGGLSGGPGGTIASTGGTGGSTPTGPGGNGSATTGASGPGGGGGASDGAGNGGSGGNGGIGAEFFDGVTNFGSGGGGGANGGITSGSTPAAGNGGLYGGGGAGGGAKGTSTSFGIGAQGIIIVTYTPPVNPTIIPPGGGIFVIP